MADSASQRVLRKQSSGQGYNFTSSNELINPALPGFNPDPSILRVGEDYFIATSTFEWFPGVQIHHSKDLKHWRLATRPLCDNQNLDLTGVPDSGGIWAPCLSWFDGTFYLAYTIVYELNSRMKDLKNFLVTSDDIEGPWSKAIELNRTGFDPSFYHSEDGRKWFLNMVWDHRPKSTFFYGISIQEFCQTTKQLIGKPKIIYKGTELGFTEGPHIYKKDGYYYLLIAEGGTSWDHAVTIARSKQLMGPYAPCPHNPILTSVNNQLNHLQKAGHGSLVETQDGRWYLAHLCSRPLPGLSRCPLGRETALQEIYWDNDGWPRLINGTNSPSIEVSLPALPEHPWPPRRERETFSDPVLDSRFQSPRTQLKEPVLSLTEKPEVLRLRGGQSLASKFEQSIVATRLESHQAKFQLGIDFRPECFQQMAGLVCYYSTKIWHYLCVSHDEEQGRCLYIQSNHDGEISFPLGDTAISIPNEGIIHLRADFQYESLRFAYSIDESNWTIFAETLDASTLSDDFGKDWGFTGCFVGMACQDLTGSQLHADFHYFESQT